MNELSVYTQLSFLPVYSRLIRGAMELDVFSPRGIVVCVGEGIKEDFSAPQDMIMGYLSYWFRGVDMAIRSGEIEAAAKEAGFSGTETRKELLCSGTQDIVILRK